MRSWLCSSEGSFPLLYAARRARDFAPYGGKTIPKRGEFWNGRIRRVPHAAKLLDCKAINVCSTHFFVFHLEHNHHTRVRS